MIPSSTEVPGPSITKWNHILELASDSGPCGRILGEITHGQLLAAARRNDPWDFLLAEKNLSKDASQFCHAAKSADHAAHRLARMAYGIASTRADTAEKYKTAVHDKNKQEIERLEKGLVLKIETAFPGRLEMTAPPQLRPLVNQKITSRRESLSRRVGAQKVQTLLSHSLSTAEFAASVMRKYPREWLLITGWLRLPNGDPGLCFFSKTALAWLFHYLGFSIHPKTDPNADTRNRLRRLGLVQARPLVTGATKTPNGVILLTFGGELRPLKTPVSTNNRIRYCGFPPTPASRK